MRWPGRGRPLSPVRRLALRLRRLRGAALALLPALPLAAWALWLAPRFPATHDLLHDGHLHALYFTLFLYGHWLGTDPGLWAALARGRWHWLAWALALAAALVAWRTAGGPAWGGAMLRGLYPWAAILAVLGFGHRHLDRPWPWLRWANESVYPWYILHQTLILAAAFALRPLGLGAGASALLILAATVGGCWAINDGLVRRSRWLRPLFGLPPVRVAVLPAVAAPGLSPAGTAPGRPSRG